MSSTLASVAPSSTSSSSSATYTSSSTDNNNSPLFNTSTLLFGFLVSALSIFGAFMTFAIIWNRLIARRRAIEAMIALSSSRSAARPLHRPRMWDIWVISDKKPLQWLDIKPLAAGICNELTDLSQTARAQHSVSFWRRHLLGRLPPEITYLFHQPIPPTTPPPSDTEISQVELTHGSDVQVSLLISMPRAPSTREREEENSPPFHELVLGTTNVVYHDPASS